MNKKIQKNIQFPQKSKPYEQVLTEMKGFKDQDARWHDGKTWSLVYHYNDEHYDFLKKAHNMFMSENALNPGAFPSLKRFEAEVVSMACDLLGGDESTTGNMTSGGTESILMAMKTYREQARALKSHIKYPEIIVPITIHPAFEKAGHYFDIKMVHAPIKDDYKVDVDAVKRLINENTIALVGSAPQYPHGVIDPIVDLAALAKEKGLGMHVDACVGGFLLPFLKKLGTYDIPPFDLSVDGVTSMSADLHKYGFTAKGASVVLYRSKELRKFQYFQYVDWPGGLFGSPSICGTRPGGPIAAAWATFQALGVDGYLKMATEIMTNTKKLIQGIESIDGMKILGKPNMSVFAYTTDKANIFVVGDMMEKRGWHVDRQQNPDCLHAMVTPNHGKVIDGFIKDLRDAHAEALAKPEAAQSGMAAMYGMMARLQDRTMAKGQIAQYMDGLYDA